LWTQQRRGTSVKFGLFKNMKRYDGQQELSQGPHNIKKGHRRPKKTGSQWKKTENWGAKNYRKSVMSKIKASKAGGGKKKGAN